jgi:hypothetical protein
MAKIKDLVGNVYGELTVLELNSTRSSGGSTLWKCRCSCGNIIISKGNNLNSGNTMSCGCSKKSNLSGLVFGRLKVLEQTDLRSKDGSIKWLCSCSCGTICTVPSVNLVRGNTSSCGCLQKELAGQNGKKFLTTHAQSYSPVYPIWAMMVQRCTNPKNVNFHKYGGRGITVCDKWLTFEGFYADMGDRPTENHSIERIKNNGNYEPSNCKWATVQEQANNTRRNKIITYKGETNTIAMMARKYNLRYGQLYHRLRQGWSVDKSIETPMFDFYR